MAETIEQTDLTALTSEDGMILFAKGWLDKESFAAAVSAYGEEAKIETVKHCYGAWLVGPTDDGPDQLLYLKTKPGRGRFKITYWASDPYITAECADAIIKEAEGMKWKGERK